MYQAHFHLREEPFGVSPDGRFVFETEQYREALATVYYAVQQRRGFALLVARAGLGKTTLLFRLFQMLEGQAEIAFLPSPYFNRATLLEALFAALGLHLSPSDSENHRVFYEFLTRLQQAGKTCVIAFDEAQVLSPDTLEAIRLLSNFETPSQKLVQIVLAGQPGLAQMIKQPEFEQLRQRLSAIGRLTPLSSASVRDYVTHRLKVAGASTELFAPHALQAIAGASGGVPRNVNTICFNALTLAYARNHSQVRYEDVAEVLWDLELSRVGSADFDIAELGLANPGVTAPSPVSNISPVPEPQGVANRQPPPSGRFKVRYRSSWGPLVRFLKSFTDEPTPASLIGKDHLPL